MKVAHLTSTELRTLWNGLPRIPVDEEKTYNNDPSLQPILAARNLLAGELSAFGYVLRADGRLVRGL